MTIRNYDKFEFSKKLAEYLSVSEPIDSIEHLFGREKELTRIERALYIPGRHIFIFGDRGVGKSSLAATAATQYQSVNKSYVDIGCGPSTTLFSVVANIVYKAFDIDRIYNKSSTQKKSFSFRGLTFGVSEKVSLKDIKAEITDLVDVIEFLRVVAAYHSESPIVVIDEFDRISCENERALFADLLKALGDKRIHLKFIFTGVASSLDQLIGAHASAIRQLETIELPRLTINARWEILRHAAKAFDLEIDKEVEVRVALVSDGFPYYVHLMGFAIMWNVFDDENMVSKISWHHYTNSIPEAIEKVDVELKKKYEMAVLCRSPEYEEVLWGTADTEWLDRPIGDMYTSYVWLSEKLGRHEILSQDKFSSRVQSLRKSSYGEVLIPRVRRGMYTYKEKMFRGFVRLQAEANGITLSGEAIENREFESARAPVSVRVGYHASMIPSGVKFTRETERKEWKGKK